MGHYAAGSYDRAVAYRHAGADRDVTSQPTVLPDADRVGRFDGLATKSVVNRMLRGVEGQLGPIKVRLPMVMSEHRETWHCSSRRHLRPDEAHCRGRNGTEEGWYQSGVPRVSWLPRLHGSLHGPYLNG